jgi:tetratricopeptide (TPR) repeat protein
LLSFKFQMNLFNRIFLLFSISFSSFFVWAQPGKNTLDEKKRMEFDLHFFDGMKEKMINNFIEAETAFRAAILVDPKNANVHYQMACVLLAQKKQDEAIFEAERAFNLETGNLWYSKFLIELYKSSRQFTEAVKVCELAYKTSKDVYFLQELAVLYNNKNDAKKALTVLNLIEKELGITEEISSKKEAIYLKSNKLKAAIKEIEKLCNAFPKEARYKGMLADLYMNANKEKEALAIYKQIQLADIKNGYSALSLADFYQRKKDTAAYYQQIVLAMQSQLEPNIKMQVLAMIIPTSFLGAAHRKLCKALIDTFITYHPNSPEPHIFNGDMALQERNFELARSHYWLALEMNRNNMMVWEQVLFCAQQIPNYNYLLSDCEKMIQAFPDYGVAYFYHSIAARQLEMMDSAVVSARMAVSLAKDEEMVLQMLSNLGDIAHYAKQYETSDSAFEAVLALEPNSALSLNNYAYFLSLRNSQMDKALNMSKKSLELDPNNPSNLDTYGWILYSLDKFDEAKIYIEKSLKISPNNAEVLDHLGDVFFRLGNKEEANINWRKAQSLGLNSAELQQKINTQLLPKK